MNCTQALKTGNLDRFTTAIATEFDKVLNKFPSIRPILPCNIDADAVRIPSSLILKEKWEASGNYDRNTARLAAGGNGQPGVVKG